MTLHYGPAFRRVTQVCSDARTGWARIRPDIEDLDAYHLHPCLLDPCLQALASVLVDKVDRHDPSGFLPFQFARLVLCGPAREVSCCRVVVRRKSARTIVADFILADASGRTLVEIEGFRFRRMRLTRADAAGPAHYRFRPELRSRRDGGTGQFLPRPTDIAEHLVPKITEQWYTHNRSDYYAQVLPLFDALIAAFAYRAVKQLLGSRTRFSLNGLLAASGVDSQHAPLLARLVGMLEEDRVVERDGPEWTLVDAPDLSSPEEI